MRNGGRGWEEGFGGGEDCGFGEVGWGRVLRIGVVELDSDRGYSERINLAGRACPNSSWKFFMTNPLAFLSPGA